LVEIGVIWWFPPGLWERIGDTAGNALIGVGLAVEYIVIGKTIIASGEAKRESDAGVAAAEARAAEADRKAAEANLELAKFRAPRDLSQEQIARVADSVRPFAGVQYDFAISATDAEVLVFIDHVERALNDAGWNGINWQGHGQIIQRLNSITVRPGSDEPTILKPTIGIGTTPVLNVQILVLGGQPRRLLEAAQALAAALMAVDIAARAAWTPPNIFGMSTNQDAIHLLIGRKV
jgi:hypothetical protein